MPRVTFLKPFTWSPKTNVRIVYKAGKSYLVPRACWRAAVSAGVIDPAEPMSAPAARSSIPVEDDDGA